MKRKTTTLLGLLLGLGISSFAQTANVQVIHNSPDPAASSVDVFVNGVEALSDVDYRTASPFLPVLTNEPTVIGIATASLTNTYADTIKTFTFDLTDGENYYIIADGLVGTSFDLYPYAGARTEATSGNENTDFAIYHGAIDAPSVDIFVEESGENVSDDLSFSEFEDYIEVATSDYNVQVRDETSSVTVGGYEAPLATLELEGDALLVMASGYLNAVGDQPTFGLFAVLADGTVEELSTSMARAQIIHNSPAAGAVDVWVNNVKALANVEYRTATAFIDLPVGLNQMIAVTAAESNDTVDAAIQASLNTEGQGSYYIIADGDIANQPLGLSVFEGAREVATSNEENTDFVIYHGGVDAPTVDIFVEEVDANISDDLSFGEFEDYTEVETADYNVQVRDETSSVTVGAYEAMLESAGLEGGALLIMASGYLNPILDQPSFGLFAVLANGTVIEVDQSNARVQVIHNSPAAGMVDIWVNNELTIENVDYRSATEFTDFPVGLDQKIAVTLAGSLDTTNAPIQASLETKGIGTYYVIADGDVANQPLGLSVFEGAREEATSDVENIDFVIYHGGVDAPAVDVYVEEVEANVTDDLSYGEFEDYIEVGSADYNVQVRDASSTVTVAGYEAPLASLSLDGDAILVMASGYLDTTGGLPAFGLFAVLADGSVVMLPTSNARAQIIHNSPAAGTVDIWVNNMLAVEAVEYRNATAYLDLPVGLNQMIAVTATGSADTVGAAIQALLDLEGSGTYVVVADGDVTNQPLGLYVTANAREEASFVDDNTDVLVYHGGTNAPDVNVDATGAGNLIEGLSFGEFADYLELPTADYMLEIRANSDNSLVEDYMAPLETLGLLGESIVVIASGYLAPETDQPAFGLFAILSNGSVAELGAITATTETFEEAGIAVYPNPATSSISISQDEFDSMTIVDMTGNTVYEGSTVDRLNVSTFNSGIYIMTMNNGSTSVVGKLIVE